MSKPIYAWDGDVATSGPSAVADREVEPAEARRWVRLASNCSASQSASFTGHLSLADAAFESFESVFCNNMVLVLDSYFVHRGRAIEGKDGNPLNEVRILCHSMTHNNETMASDTSINMNPAKSVLKYRVGDQIRLSEQDFLLIAKAFFAEIESKFATVS